MSNGMNPNAMLPYWQSQLWRDLMQFVTMLFALYASHVGVRNNDKIQQVEQKQGVAADKAEVVKDKIEAKEEEDASSKGIQLYSTWKYLEDVSSHSMSAKDIGKAAEARALYDAHVKKHGKKASAKDD